MSEADLRRLVGEIQSAAGYGLLSDESDADWHARTVQEVTRWQEKKPTWLTGDGNRRPGAAREAERALLPTSLALPWGPMPNVGGRHRKDSKRRETLDEFRRVEGLVQALHLNHTSGTLAPELRRSFRLAADAPILDVAAALAQHFVRTLFYSSSHELRAWLDQHVGADRDSPGEAARHHQRVTKLYRALLEKKRRPRGDDFLRAGLRGLGVAKDEIGNRVKPV